MFKVRLNPGIGDMVFLTRIFCCFVIVCFVLSHNFSGWLVPAFFIPNLVILWFLRRRVEWWKIYFLEQYFIDVLVTTWALFFFKNDVFLVFYCLFVLFARYQGGDSFGKIYVVICIVSYEVGLWLSQTGGFAEPLILSIALKPMFFVLSYYLGALLRDVWKEKNIAIESLESRLKNKDQLLSTLAHELRTPLTLIRSSSDILLDGRSGKVNETQSNFLNTISDSTMRLISIVEDILAQIKAESSLLKMDIQSIDLRKLVRHVVSSLEPILAQDEQTLRCSYPKLISKTLADEKWIQQALINLIHNASKYIGHGGSILVSITENEQWFVVSVIDDGAGITDVNSMQIFSKLQNNDDEYQSYEGGAGIGLSIVKYVVEQHSGKLYVGTVPGLGTTLSFTLPKEQG
ncbi:MAG: sensor histidine kinase [Arenicella sp.]